MRTTRPPSARVAARAWRGDRFVPGELDIPEETPVAITYNGSTHAVMMATPADLTDFAIGFSLTEGIVDGLDDIDSVEIEDCGEGLEARLWLKADAALRDSRRRRVLLGPTGCGLCGVDSIAQALKPVPRVHSRLRVSPEDLFRAMARVQTAQALNAATHAVHAAALIESDGNLIVREDVGRHNALDKVIGAALQGGVDPKRAVVVLTSRVSMELVQKTARLGAPVIAAVSAPTALALRLAEAAGITVVAVLRRDGFEAFTAPERILEGAMAHGA